MKFEVSLIASLPREIILGVAESNKNEKKHPGGFTDGLLMAVFRAVFINVDEGSFYGT